MARRFVMIGLFPALIVIGGESVELTPSKTVQPSSVGARIRIGVLRIGGGRGLSVAEAPQIGQGQPFRVGGARLEKLNVSGRASHGCRRSRHYRRQIGLNEFDSAEFANTELAADIRVAKIKIVECALRTFGQIHDVAVRSVHAPVSRLEVKTPVTLPLASNVRRRIQFCV